jgi:hypothetical protein
MARTIADPAERLANARGESVDQARQRFSQEEIAQCPRRERWQQSTNSRERLRPLQMLEGTLRATNLRFQPDIPVRLRSWMAPDRGRHRGRFVVIASAPHSAKSLRSPTTPDE